MHMPQGIRTLCLRKIESFEHGFQNDSARPFAPVLPGDRLQVPFGPGSQDTSLGHMCGYNLDPTRRDERGDAFMKSYKISSYVFPPLDVAWRQRFSLIAPPSRNYLNEPFLEMNLNATLVMSKEEICIIRK
jgi:hypothetical protein